MRSPLLIGIFAVVTLFFSCGSKGENRQDQVKPVNFTIEGKIENSSGRKIYFQKIGVENLIPLDTIIPDNKGMFSISGKAEGPEFFILKTEEGPFINLLLYGKEKVSVKADYNNFKNYSVEGSPESEKIRQLSIETNKVISEIDKLNILVRDSANSPNYTDIRLKSNEKFSALMTGLRKYSLDFIDANSGSPISLLALYSQVGQQLPVFQPVNDLAVFEKVDSSLSLVYPELPLVINLHEYIAVIKAQLAAQQQPAPGFLPAGTEVPDISLLSPEGKKISLSSLRGKIVLLDFWASWCQPCRHENPVLVENYRKYHDKGFEIFQVSLDRTREDWLNGIKQDQLTWTHVSDLKYWESSVVKQYNIRGIPMNYLLDKDGKVIAGNLRGPALGEALSKIFNE